MALALAAACLQVARAGPAINQFEVKDLEVEVGRWEFQSQNAYSWRQPDRAFAELTPGVVAFDDNSVVRQRYALELELGVTERFRTRFGIEVEQERVEDPGAITSRNQFAELELEELALEGVLVLRDGDEGGVGLGLLVEYQYTLEDEEADSFVLGPILEADHERWSLVFNPALVQFFGGADEDRKLDFTYALQFGYAWSETWLLTVEAYGTIDRLGDTGTTDRRSEAFGDHDLHRLGPIAYFHRVFGRAEDPAELRLGLGVLIGLNDDTPDGTLKLSVEYEF